MINTTGWLILSVLIIVAILAIVAVLIAFKANKKTPIDYYSWFVLGIVWFIIGFPIGSYALSIMGVVFVILGLSHKREWRKNRKANLWKNLTKKQRKARIWTIIILGILFLLGIITGVLVVILGH